MDTRKGLLSVVAAAALGLSGPAHAGISHFKYFYLNFVDVDVDYSQSFANPEGEVIGRLGSDRDTGYEIAGAVGANDGWHLFGLYHWADQGLEFSGEDIDIDRPIPAGEGIKGGFDVTRWRLGLGYAKPMVPDWTLYGRVTYDSSKVSGMKVGEARLGRSSDAGIGAEVGTIYTMSHRIVLSGWLRYTSVGESSSRVNDENEFKLDFDYDLLLGIHARYFITRRFALQAGYEAGNVSTFNAGARFNF